MEQELVSIIIPVYNAEKYIEETIQSIMNQTYKNYEAIFIDDCSQDKSIEIIKRYMKNSNKIRLIKLPKNEGVAIARNAGIKDAKGRFLTFLDADDVWLETKLEKQIEFMKKNNYEFTCCNYKYMSDNGIWIGRTLKPNKRTDYKQALRKITMLPTTVMIDLDKISKDICYMPNIVVEDFACWLNILKHGYILYGQDEVLAFYRNVKTSRSSKIIKFALNRWYLYRNCEKLNLIEATYYFINYAVYAIRKRTGQKKVKLFRKSETLQVAVSTQDLKNDIETTNLVNKMNITSDYLIINQTYKKDVNIENSKVITVAETGLGKSRNMAIKNAKSDIVLISDNDVIYNENYEKTILEAHNKYKDADIICFFVKSLNPNRKIKKMYTGRIGFIKAMRIISCEVSFKRIPILKSKIKFNPILGPGSDLKIGDELWFICEALRNGLKVMFVNKKIAEVEQKESTYFKGYTKEHLFVQLKAFKVVYPKFYKIINLQYAIRKYPLYRNNVKFLESIKMAILL